MKPLKPRAHNPGTDTTVNLEQPFLRQAIHRCEVEGKPAYKHYCEQRLTLLQEEGNYARRLRSYAGGRTNR
jgi:hypothetical protein